MKQKVGAILLDTRSIQKYVFSCNKLKTNTGASYLVDSIFTDAMMSVLKEYDFKMPEEHWSEVDDVKIKSDSDIECEIAYIGGGNMLILVSKIDDELKLCREIVSKWSEKLLLMAPGLKTGAAVGYLDLDDAAFRSSLDNLYKQLKNNQNNILPQVDLPYTGLTLECDYSGKTADSVVAGENRKVAAEIKAKIEAYAYSAEKVHSQYADLLKDKQGNDEYDFCTELEEIGYKEGESYISIIHIDGNNMGVKFSECRSMQERKQLSLKVAQIVQDGFRRLISSIIAEYDRYAAVLDMQRLKVGHKKILPLRPIIIGGDDITFICPAKLALTYAQRFIEFVNSYELINEEFHNHIITELSNRNNGSDINISRSLSCCAGVAIVPAKYPFFRAYELAEQLCGAAKEKSRKDDGSYLDYIILHGEMCSKLEQLREQQYKGIYGNLHYGPYNVLDKAAGNRYIGKLLDLEKELGNGTVAQNKVKELRSVLNEDLHKQEIFLEHTEKLKNILQHETGNRNVTAEAFWEKTADGNFVTRFIDAIEIMDFVFEG